MALGAEDRKTCLKCMPILLNSHVGSPELEESGYYQLKKQNPSVYTNKTEEGNVTRLPAVQDEVWVILTRRSFFRIGCSRKE